MTGERVLYEKHLFPVTDLFAYCLILSLHEQWVTDAQAKWFVGDDDL